MRDRYHAATRAEPPMTSPDLPPEDTNTPRSDDRLTLNKELKGMTLLYVVFVVLSVILAMQCVERRDGVDSSANHDGGRP